MKKIYMIGYEEDYCYDGFNSIIETTYEKSAFKDYRAANYFLIYSGFKPVVPDADYNSREHGVPDLVWWNSETGIEAEIHELLIAE